MIVVGVYWYYCRRPLSVPTEPLPPNVYTLGADLTLQTEFFFPNFFTPHYSPTTHNTKHCLAKVSKIPLAAFMQSFPFKKGDYISNSSLVIILNTGLPRTLCSQ